MEFFDFELRAWQAGKTQVNVMVQASPVGDMRRPVTVPCDPTELRTSSDYALNGLFGRGLPSAGREKVIQLGRKLSSILLPRPVYNLLNSSLLRIPAGGGLRLRLCLDESLIDLPWEFLYRPDATDGSSLGGFLALDHRVSLVREAPLASPPLRPSPEKQRLVFAAMVYDSGQLVIGAEEEYARLSEALVPVKELLAIEFITAAENDIETALAIPAGIFHYSGTTGVLRDGRACLATGSSGLVASEKLGSLLRESGTRLAMFSADRSGRWAFVEPLLRAGLPALVAAQDILDPPAYVAFCQKMYSSLAVGLSLDESVVLARLHLFEISNSPRQADYNWAGFMVYMPAPDAVLFPRPESVNIRARQQDVRQDRQQTIEALTQAIGQAPGGKAPTDKRALRQGILGAFDLGELKVLCADVEQDLEDDGIKLPVSLEMVGGEDGLESKILDLIDYLDRRSYLAYLVDAVRRARPTII